MALPLHNRNRLNGRWIDSKTSRRFAIHDPADLRDVVHEYPLSSSEDARVGIDSAASFFKEWRRVPIAERSAIMRRAAALIEAHRDQIAALLTRENGKLLRESHAEIESTISEIYFQTGEGERQFGAANQSHRGPAFGYTRKEPLGVVSVIVPWNFPFNVPFRKLVPALMAGNTAILKPASQTAGVGELVVQILTEAGLPSLALQFVTGSGRELSDALVGSEPVRAVTFTGSTDTGRAIARSAAPNFVRTQLEMGGKNPIVVLADADLELAADQAVVGAFSCAGQWCTATSRVIVEEPVCEELEHLVLQRAGEITVGPGTDPRAQMGPVCGISQLESVLAHIELAEKQGATRLLGGRRALEGGLGNGCFVLPSVYRVVHRGMAISSEEIFGPVLALESAPDYEQALQLANDVEYGLSSSVFTSDVEKAMHFAEHSEVGLAHINMHSAYKEPQFCFGGVKESGFGLPEAGSSGIRFFQEEKAIYIRR